MGFAGTHWSMQEAHRTMPITGPLFPLSLITTPPRQEGVRVQNRNWFWSPAFFASQMLLSPDSSRFSNQLWCAVKKTRPMTSRCHLELTGLIFYSGRRKSAFSVRLCDFPFNLVWIKHACFPLEPG